ncbi:MAG: LysR family transcriptional regulator [Rhodococcus sp. (in: high G+C Gram-positive bacteria)]
MELRQLEYFVAVVEEANFTRAAARVHISQSGISAQIRVLENEIGAELVDRSTRVAKPTEAGRAVLEHARVALEAAGAVQRSVDEINALVRGTVDIGMVTACTVTPLFDGLADFHADYPGVEVRLREGASSDLIDSVRSGALDLALVGASGSPPVGLDSLVIVREGLAACVPHDDAFARASSVSLREVCARRVVCLPRGTGIRTVFDEACAAKGFVADIAFDASAPGAVADLAARGMGVGILSRSMATDYASRLIAVPVDDIPVDALLVLVWSERAGVATEEMVSRLRRHFSG